MMHCTILLLHKYIATLQVEPCVDHVLTDGLLDMLPLHCPALPAALPGALHPALKDPFVLLLELLRQTCGPHGGDAPLTYAEDLRTLVMVRRYESASRHHVVLYICMLVRHHLLCTCATHHRQALIHAVYVPAACRALLTAHRLHTGSTAPPTAALAQALEGGSSAAGHDPPSEAHATTAAHAGPSKRPRQHSPGNHGVPPPPAPSASQVQEDVARLLLPLLRRAAVLLALVLEAAPPTLEHCGAQPELAHWQALLRLPGWARAAHDVLAVPGAATWLARWVDDRDGRVECARHGVVSILRALPDTVHGRSSDTLHADREAPGQSWARVPYPAAPRLLPLPELCQVGGWRVHAVLTRITT